MARPLLCLDGWLIALRLKGCSPKTIRKNEDTVRRFISAIGETSEIDEITTQDIRRYLSERQRGLAPSSLHTERSVLHTFFQFCKAEDLIDLNPVDKVASIIIPKRLIPILPIEVIKGLLSICDESSFLGARNRAIILTFLDTGVRRSELCRMKRADVFKEAIIIMGKGNKERYVRISPRTQKAIWRYLVFRRDDLPNLWLTEERRPLQSEGIRMMIDRLTDRAGITDYKVSAHVFRHTYATEMLRLGVDERSLQAFLGHSTSAMTRRYTEQFSSLDALRLHQVSPVDSMGL